MTRYNFLFAIFGLIGTTAFAQNLVPNPSFEFNTECPYSTGDLEFAEPWSTATPVFWTSSEYFHSCNCDLTSDVCVPDSYFGSQNAHTGQAYAGFIPYLTNFGDYYHESLQVELLEPLLSGYLYEVSLWINLADNCGITTDELGIYLSEGPIVFTYDIDFVPQITTPDGVYFTDKVNWMEFSSTYTAIGGEDHITIANFKPFIETDTIQLDGDMDWSIPHPYIHIDDVSVIELQPSIEITGDTLICQGDSITLFGSTPDFYQWYTVFDPDVILSTESEITVAPDQTTLYFLSNGEFVSNHLVEVLPPPTLELGEDILACEGDHVILAPETNADEITWQDESTGATYTAVEDGSYIATVQNIVCTISDSVLVNFQSPFALDLGEDLSFCTADGHTIDLSYLDDNFELEWGDGTTSELFSTNQSGTYILNGFDGVCPFYDEITLEAISCEFVLEMPNIFTPNSEYANNYFEPIISSNIISMQTNIFNRWGTLVHTTDELEKLWNGRNLLGWDMPEGTYYYVIEYTSIKETGTISGSLTLLR